MNIVNKLALRMLKENKRRTLVTILGVIISVAMITAVATLFVSFINLLQQEAIAENGEWHVLYKDVDQEQLEEIKQDEQSETVFLTRNTGFAYLQGSENPDKPYLMVKEYDPNAFDYFTINLLEGRLPENPNEIVISQQISETSGVQLEIGQTIELQVGDRYFKSENDEGIIDDSLPLMNFDGSTEETIINTNDKSYTIVGIIQQPAGDYLFVPGYTAISYIDEKIITSNDQVDASVLMKDINRDIFDYSNNLAERLNISEVRFNTDLLRFHSVIEGDNLNRTFITLAGIIIAIIMVGSVSLIYNAFAISVSERSRYLGMLASVGATKRQKRNSVYFEGAVISLISIPLGLLTGIGGISITLNVINGILQSIMDELSGELAVVVTPISIIIAVAISLVTIFISVFVPAIRASKITAIDAIRQTQDIKMTKKKVKTSKLVRKIFGIEAEIGLKNLKRNKRRYNATIFSLVISIVLFLSVSFFAESLQKSADMAQFNPEYDLVIHLNERNQPLGDDVIKQIRSLDDITESALFRTETFNANVDQELLPESLYEETMAYPELLTDGKYNFYIYVHGLEGEDLKNFTEQIDVDYYRITNSEKATAIVINKNHYYDMEKEMYVLEEAIRAEIGDTLNVQYEDWETEKIMAQEEVEIVGITEEYPLGVDVDLVTGNFNLIVSKATFDKLIPSSIEPSSRTLYIKSSDPMRTAEQIEDMNIGQIFMQNYYEYKKSDEQVLLILSIFVYGFITLITLITVSNIFNTVSTSIMLRKREFGMLKSVGMTPKGFNKMINYESIFYGLKSLLYGLPISIIVMFLIYRATGYTFAYDFHLPWKSIGIVILAVFLIVGFVMLYSSSKVKKENIIDALKQENI